MSTDPLASLDKKIMMLLTIREPQGLEDTWSGLITLASCHAFRLKNPYFGRCLAIKMKRNSVNNGDVPFLSPPNH